VPDDDGMYFGILFSCYPLAKAPLVPLVGYASDRYGHRVILTGSLLLLGAALAATALTTSYTGLLMCRLLTGAAGANGALLHAWIPKLAAPDEHIYFFADLTMAWSLAFVLGK
jgi:MFS family permease